MNKIRLSENACHFSKSILKVFRSRLQTSLLRSLGRTTFRVPTTRYIRQFLECARRSSSERGQISEACTVSWCWCTWSGMSHHFFVCNILLPYYFENTTETLEVKCVDLFSCSFDRVHVLLLYSWVPQTQAL